MQFKSVMSMLAVADRTLKANTQYNLKGLNKLVGWKTHSHDAVDKTYSVHCKNTGKLQKQRGELIFALLLTHSLLIHQTHYEKSDWSRAFNQFTIACKLDMINAISAADTAFIISSSTSARLLSPLECSQKQNGWTLRFFLRMNYVI